MAEGDNRCMLLLATVAIVFLLFSFSNNGRARLDMFSPKPSAEASAEGEAEGEAQAEGEAPAAEGEAPATKPSVETVPVVGPSEAPLCPSDSPTPYVDQTGALVDGPGFDKSAGSLMDYQAGGNVPSNYYFLDDGAGGEMSVMHNVVSPSCCGESWPTPFQKTADPYVCGNKDKFAQTRLFGNNTYQDSGCMCVSKKQAQFMYNRGNNAGGWF